MSTKEDIIKDSITDDWYNDYKDDLLYDYFQTFSRSELVDWIKDNYEQEFIDEFHLDFKDFVEAEREAHQVHQVDKERLK